MNKNKYDIRIILFFLMLYKVIDMNGQIKYAIAMGITFLIFMAILINKEVYDVNLKDLIVLISPSMFYILYSTVIVYAKSNYHQLSYFMKESLFIITSILLAWAIAIWIKDKFDIKLLFWSMAIIFLIDNIIRFSAEDLMESTFCFAFGALLMYFFVKKEWKYVLISFIFVYLANKRVVLLALVVAILVKVVTDIAKNIKMKHIIWLSIIFLAFLYIYGISISWLDTFAMDNKINTMGRLDIYKYVEELYQFRIDFLGNGIGAVMTKLETLNISTARNLHNDFLKLYIEIGFWGLLIYCLIYNYIFSYINKKYEKSLQLVFILFVYTFMLYTTDNTLIYICYLTPLYTVIFYDIYMNRGDLY